MPPSPCHIRRYLSYSSFRVAPGNFLQKAKKEAALQMHSQAGQRLLPQLLHHLQRNIQPVGNYT